VQSGDGGAPPASDIAGVVMAAKAKVGSVVEALERDLAAVRKRAPAVADSTLAAAAMVLARELDDADNSATSKSMCARALAEALDTLQAAAPDTEETSKLDELNARRAARLGRPAS
jgi:hypothetical protein